MGVCRKRSRSASAIVANKSSGYHILRIHGYSDTLTTATGQYLESLPFTVGGHRWCIHYYPNGDTSKAKDYISLYLKLLGSVAKSVKAEFKFCLFSNVAKQWRGVHSFQCGSSSLGWPKFIKRREFEASKHLRNDSFAIRCNLVVIHDFRVVEGWPQATAAASMISVPPCDLQQHLGSLLQTEKGADVVFDVAGETFAAHRCVLAARSPVFSAELFGAMKESDTGGVVHIQDMEPRVFKALLYFVYTGLFPNTERTKEVEEEDDEGVFPPNPLTNTKMENAEEGDMDVMSQHLLVAADKYNLERLKLLCESKLCEYINVSTVGTILALAEQHNCHELKKVCFHFLSIPSNLRAAVVSDGFKHLSRSCPSVMEELVSMLGT